MIPYPVRRTSLTEADAEAIDREFAALTGAASPHLALDLVAVEFLSSTALTRFIRLDRELKGRGGRLTLVNVRPAVRQVFAVTRLDRLLDVRGS
jgi:anti-anti-sigma factor